ncbi:MAG TPA: GNAT family N-acetyltransferase [Mycobacterium sp.]|jgi:RimJ/RimL family protein N-acetyltransferase|nr:GNAT family N-acetyltransferase [Mycobacterium sp.]
MAILTTDRLRLRPWTPADADFAFDLYSRWEVQRYIGRSPRVMADRAEAEAAIAKWCEPRGPVHGVWALERSDDCRLIGTMLLKSIPASGPQEPLSASGDTEIGWHLHPDAWGLGYATEAGRCVLEHAFTAGLLEVVAVTHPANIASQAVALRIGMSARGLTDRYYNATCALFGATNPFSRFPTAA